MATSSNGAGWERFWREGIRDAVQRIMDEEAEAAAERVKARTKELGAKLALELSKHADIRRMEDRLVITIHMQGLEPAPKREPGCRQGGHYHAEQGCPDCSRLGLSPRRPGHYYGCHDSSCSGCCI